MTKPVPLALAALSAGLALLLAGCVGPDPTASDPTVEEYCGIVEKHKDRYLTAMAASDSGSLLGLVTAASAIGDLKAMWSELADHAPDDIRSDTASVRDAWEEQEDAALEGDYREALGRALVDSGPVSRVDSYIRENCDISIDSTSDEPSASGTLDLAPGQDWKIMGGFLVKATAVSSDRLSGAFRLFTPESGDQLVDAAELLTGETVTGQEWTAAGSPEDRFIVGAVEVRRPATGLEPEEYVTSLVTLRLVDGMATVRTRTELFHQPCGDATLFLVGSHSGAVAATYEEGCGLETKNRTAAWDATSGSELWTSEDGAWASGTGSVVLASDIGGCTVLRGVDIQSGDTQWTYDSRGMPVGGRCGSPDVWDERGDSALLGGSGQHGFSYHLSIDYDRDDAYAVDYAVDGGHRVTTMQDFDLFDPVEGFGLTFGKVHGSSRGVPGLTVFDTSTGTTVFEIGRERLDSLNARPTALIAGRLFLTTSDQELEIDVTSGEVVSEASTGHALGIAGDYAYFTDGTLVPKSSINDYRPAIRSE